jgi:hypothetical protein
LGDSDWRATRIAWRNSPDEFGGIWRESNTFAHAVFDSLQGRAVGARLGRMPQWSVSSSSRRSSRWFQSGICCICIWILATGPAARGARPASELSVDGTRFKLDGMPFYFCGVSFFNALFNPAFNKDSAARREWLRKFQGYGINVLRIWAQWDNTRGFVDGAPTHTLYENDGSLRAGRGCRHRTLSVFARELSREHSPAGRSRHQGCRKRGARIAAVAQSFFPNLE